MPYAGGACESAAAAAEFVMGDKSFLAMEIHGWGILHDQPVFSFLSPPLAREEREKAYFFVSLSPSPPFLQPQPRRRGCVILRKVRRLVFSRKIRAARTKKTKMKRRRVPSIGSLFFSLPTVVLKIFTARFFSFLVFLPCNCFRFCFCGMQRK